MDDIWSDDEKDDDYDDEIWEDDYSDTEVEEKEVEEVVQITPTPPVKKTEERKEIVALPPPVIQKEPPRWTRYVRHGLTRHQNAITMATQLTVINKQSVLQKALDSTQRPQEDDTHEKILALGLLLTDPEAALLGDDEGDDESGDENDDGWESEVCTDSEADTDEDEDERTERKSRKARAKALEALKERTQVTQSPVVTIHPSTKEWMQKIRPLEDGESPTFKAVSEFLFAFDAACYDGDFDTEIGTSLWTSILTASPWSRHLSGKLSDMLFNVARTKTLRTLTAVDMCQLYCWLGHSSTVVNNPELPPVHYVIPFLHSLFNLGNDRWPAQFEGIPFGDFRGVVYYFSKDCRNLILVLEDGSKVTMFHWDNEKKILTVPPEALVAKRRYVRRRGKPAFRYVYELATLLQQFCSLASNYPEVMPHELLCVS